MTTEQTTTLDATCPACSEPVAAGDVFCESCGTALDPAEAVLAGAPPISTEGEDGPTTAPVDPAYPAPPTTCPSCGGVEFADGFCSTCGTKRPTWRDHFTEQPTDWLAGGCDKGIVHHRNEDAMAMAAVGERAVLVVCDGVTTAPDSDRASLAAARAARDVLAAAPPAPAGTAAAVAHWSEHLTMSCAAANREAVAVARILGNPPEPPSCTFVASVAEGGLVVTAWCGDSRSYWLGDDGSSRALSVDHSLGTEMIAAGKTRAEAEADPTSHTITRWLGADSVDPTPETGSHEPTGPGWLLVCSDGLWNYISEPDALQTMVRDLDETDPLAIAEHLVAFANAAGGQDNITAVLARLGDAPD